MQFRNRSQCKINKLKTIKQANRYTQCVYLLLFSSKPELTLCMRNTKKQIWNKKMFMILIYLTRTFRLAELPLSSQVKMHLSKQNISRIKNIFILFHINFEPLFRKKSKTVSIGSYKKITEKKIKNKLLHSLYAFFFFSSLLAL